MVTVSAFIAITPVARLVCDEVAIGGVAAEGPLRPGGQSQSHPWEFHGLKNPWW
jgi:hypothetical protein